VRPPPPPVQQININNNTIINNQTTINRTIVQSAALPASVVSRVNAGALQAPHQEIERAEHRDLAGASTAQRLEVGQPVRPDHHGLTVDGKALGLEDRRAFGDGREPRGPVDRLAAVKPR
jgi:hypothetical protein